MPAAERLPPLSERQEDGPGSPDGPDSDSAGVLELLKRGELTVRGRLRDASNATLYCTVELDGTAATCVYKPVAGERPLWDFPDGTLAEREQAAREVSVATGWHLVPPTVLRESGPHGPGMCQLWIDPPEPPTEIPELLALHEGDDPQGIGPGWLPIAPARLNEGTTGWLVHADDGRLRRLAVLDVVLNNADRKGGHLLPAPDGRLHAIDHGVTFAVEDKLRTLLWGWAGQPLPEEALRVLRQLSANLDGGPLGGRLAELLTAEEVAATRARVAGLLDTARHPEPSGEWPSIPWPPV
jgi:uncharacterized repeat protein (TIGR03843 family)